MDFVSNEEKLLSSLRNNEKLIEVIVEAKNTHDNWQQIKDLWCSVKNVIIPIFVLSLVLFVFSIVQGLIQVFSFIFFILAVFNGFLVISCTTIEKFKPNSWLDFVSKEDISDINVYLDSIQCGIKIIDTEASKKRTRRKIVVNTLEELA